MRYQYLLSLFLLLGWQVLPAQQYPLFTNYVLNSFGYNPAIAGSADYIDTRLVFRTQWTGLEDAPQTQILSMHGRVADKFGIGGFLYNDEAGSLARRGATGVFSLSQKVGQRSRLNVGVSGGYYQFRLSDDYVATSNVDPLLADAGSGAWTADLNAGVYFTSGDFYLGISVPQVINNRVRFSSEIDIEEVLARLEPHYYGMSGYRFALNSLFSLEPSVLMKYVPEAPLQVDAAVRVFYNDFIWAGGSYRSDDAVTCMLGMNLGKSFSIGYAYDLTTSQLRTVSSGSHEFTLGFRFGGPKDSDGDGLIDKLDECPDEPGPPENNGCPEEEAESEEADEEEEDGVPAAMATGEEKWPDKDYDGIRDDIDKCPTIPGVFANNGCPIEDRDQDGVTDAKDKCPDEPGELKNEGCPWQDRDGDGVPDHLDKCPDLAGNPEENGCPKVSDLEKEILELAIRNLYFDTNKDEIRPESYSYLDKLAELLRKQQGYRIQISGHADSTGPDQYNLELSRRRAQAVYFYLVNKGIPESQLRMQYFGENAPMVPNSDKGRLQLNRRVEMKFVWD